MPLAPDADWVHMHARLGVLLEECGVGEEEAQVSWGRRHAGAVHGL